LLYKLVDILSAVFIIGALAAFVNTIYYFITGRGIISKRQISTKKVNMDFFDDKKGDFIITAASVLLSRLALVIIAALIGWVCTKAMPDLDFSTFRWLRWDANHYISIAAYGYQTVGDARNFIVFFPLYPFFIRLFSYIFRDYVIAAYVVSNVSAAISGYFLYLLVKDEYDEATAYRALKYYLIFPFSFFLLTPMSESLFMMFLLGTVYFARKKKWLLCGIFGYACALSRLLGVLVAIPVFIEAVMDLTDKFRSSNQGINTYLNPFKKIWAKLAGLIMILLGLGTYLYINYRVHGDWFKFLEFQENHWHNKAQRFDITLKSTLEYFLSDGYNLNFKLGVSIPNMLMFIVGVIIIWYAIAKMRPAHGAFLVAYMLLAYSPSWLLSGGRYMIGAYPLYIAFSRISRNRAVDIVLTFINLLLLIFYSTIYFMFGAMY